MNDCSNTKRHHNFKPGSSAEQKNDTKINSGIILPHKKKYYICNTLNIICITMKARVTKKPTAFRLDESLIDKLKAEAKKTNRSLSNYVECILMDSVYNEPNEDTLEAIAEARAKKYAGKFDMNNFDTFMKSVNDIK